MVVAGTVQILALKDVDDQTWNFHKDRKGRIILLDFWTRDCMPCQKTMPILTHMQSKLGPQGLEVVGVFLDNGTLKEQSEREEGLLPSANELPPGPRPGRQDPAARTVQSANVPVADPDRRHRPNRLAARRPPRRGDSGASPPEAPRQPRVLTPSFCIFLPYIATETQGLEVLTDQPNLRVYDLAERPELYAAVKLYLYLLTDYIQNTGMSQMVHIPGLCL